MKNAVNYVLFFIFLIIFDCKNITPDCDCVEITDPIQLFYGESSTKSGSVQLSLQRGGQSSYNIPLGKHFSSLPVILVTSLSEVKDMIISSQNITRDSFELTIALSNNSSLPNVSMPFNFNWLAVERDSISKSIFTGTSQLDYRLKRGDSTSSTFTFPIPLDSTPLVFFLPQTVNRDFQSQISHISKSGFTLDLLLSQNSGNYNENGNYTSQWICIPQGLNKNNIKSDSGDMSYTLNRGGSISHTIYFKDKFFAPPKVFLSNFSIGRDLYSSISDITIDSFKLNLGMSGNSSAPSTEGIYRFGWLAIDK